MNVEIWAEAALFPEKEYISEIFVAVHALIVIYVFKDILLSLSAISYLFVHYGSVTYGCYVLTFLHLLFYLPFFHPFLLVHSISLAHGCSVLAFIHLLVYFKDKIFWLTLCVFIINCLSITAALHWLFCPVFQALPVLYFKAKMACSLLSYLSCPVHLSFLFPHVYFILAVLSLSCESKQGYSIFTHHKQQYKQLILGLLLNVKIYRK
jgi:hypothetical protein